MARGDAENAEEYRKAKGQIAYSKGQIAISIKGIEKEWGNWTNEVIGQMEVRGGAEKRKKQREEGKGQKAKSKCEMGKGEE